MKLLVVSPNLPRPAWGASTRNYYLLKKLASRHTVSLLALIDSSEADLAREALQHLASPVRVVVRPPSQSKRVRQLLQVLRGESYILNSHIPTEMQRILDELLEDQQYDAILFESMLMAGFRLPPKLRVIIDEHNIEYELLQRTYLNEKTFARKWYNWLESRLVRSAELARCRKADAVLVTSEREQAMLKALVPDRIIEVVPNGVDLAAFQGCDEDQVVADRIIYTGTMDYYPNSDAVLYFAQHCWPLIRREVPTATWQIVGRNPPPEVQQLSELSGITVTGSVPQVQPYLAEAAVSIVPLQIGGGTRLKILEALAMRKAVISTSLGCEGLAVTPGKHLEVADRPEKFAQAVIALLRDPQRRAQFGEAGRALVEQEYSWEKCGDRLLRVIEEMH